MRSYVTDLSKKECKSIFDQCVDFMSLSFGQEKLTGWMKYGFFSISYKSGKIRMYNPIFVKVIGKISERNGKAIVEFSTYRGLTDIFSMLFIFLGSLGILIIVSDGELGLMHLLLLSILCCSLASSITFLFSFFSSEGKEGEERIIEFLERNLRLAKSD